MLLPLVALLVWLGGPWVLAAVAASTLLGLHELYQLFAHTGYRPRTVGYICALLFVAAGALRAPLQLDLTGLVLLAPIGAPFLAELPAQARER